MKVAIEKSDLDDLVERLGANHESLSRLAMGDRTYFRMAQANLELLERWRGIQQRAEHDDHSNEPRRPSNLPAG